MVDILTKKAEEPEKQESSDQKPEEGIEKVAEKVKVEEKLTSKQEQELQDTTVSVLEKIVHEEELTNLKNKVKIWHILVNHLAWKIPTRLCQESWRCSC